GMFAPLALAVGFAMIASYILSSTFVTVASAWLLRHAHSSTSSAPQGAPEKPSAFDRLRERYERLLGRLMAIRWLLIPNYLVVCGLIIWFIGGRLGREIFPVVDTGAFRLRLRAPDGTHIGRTEQYAKQALEIVGETVGPEHVDVSLGYVGMVHSNF